MKVAFDADIAENQINTIKEISFKCGILFDTARLLYCRKIDTPKKAYEFLNGGKKDFFDPYLFSDMADAVKRITVARSKKEKVLIFGDYDADGISATTVLYNCLKKFGIEAKTFVPEREDGYGLNADKILAGEKPDLVITVDCGISDREKIEVLAENGVEVIVTDHHEPPEDLPDCLIINPKLDRNYPFDGLCGAGVAYKLGVALIGEEADEYLDFVALATVSDSMELIGENRYVVKEGLKILNGDCRPCFKSLLGEGGRQITAQTLAFSVAPKVNAGGRMGDAAAALRLFLSGSAAEIAKNSELLTAYNINRQIECDKIYREAKEKIEKSDLTEILLVCGEEWKAGFTGIVAARLAENFLRPVIVFGEQNGILKGSARSVEGINIYNVISSAKDLLVSFGGHSQAAGVSVKEEDFSLLSKRLNEYAEREYKEIVKEKTVRAEWKAEEPFSARFIKEIELLEPFGVGNKRPLFAVEEKKVYAGPLKEGSPHYVYKSRVMDMIDFNGEKDARVLTLPVKKTVIFETNVSTYKNRESIKGFIKNVIPDYTDFYPLKNYLTDGELDKILIDGGEAGEPVYGDVKKESDVLYLISDPENLKYYPYLADLPLGLYSAPEKTVGSAVVICPESISGYYKKAVYLDEPASFIETDKKTCCNFSLKGYNFVREINTERQNLIKIFTEITRAEGKPFADTVSFYEENAFSVSFAEFAFALKVFTELKIFYVKNGRLYRDKTVKSALTESSLYNGVCALKGRL